MKLLEERILKDGKVFKNGNVLKVGSFLNQMIDVSLTNEMAKETYRLFKDSGITKVLTIEASGIAFGYAVANEFNVPLTFAKKSFSSNQKDSLLVSEVFSYTRQKFFSVSIDSSFLCRGDRILIVDDFLATGAALRGLIDLVNQSGAELAGCTIQIEKGFQGGGDALRGEGIRVESLALIDEMDENHIAFR